MPLRKGRRDLVDTRKDRKALISSKRRIDKSERDLNIGTGRFLRHRRVVELQIRGTSGSQSVGEKNGRVKKEGKFFFA